MTASGAGSAEVVTELEARHRAQRGPRWHLMQRAPGETDRHAVDWLGRHGYEVYYPLLRSMRRVPRKRLSHQQRRARVAVMRPHQEALGPQWRMKSQRCFPTVGC
jgi:hypothetical protein